MTDEQAILERLKLAVEDGDEVVAASAAKEAVAAGIDPQRAIMEGLVPGMNELGRLYEAEECFVPELLVGAEALYAGLDVLRPLVAASGPNAHGEGVVVIGAVQGDVHDIGKNLVRLMLEVAGFEVHDLGRDVEMEKFIEESQPARCRSPLPVGAHDDDHGRHEGLHAQVQGGVAPDEGPRSAALRSRGTSPISGAPTVMVRSAMEAAREAKKVLGVARDRRGSIGQGGCEPCGRRR